MRTQYLLIALAVASVACADFDEDVAAPDVFLGESLPSVPSESLKDLLDTTDVSVDDLLFKLTKDVEDNPVKETVDETSQSENEKFDDNDQILPLVGRRLLASKAAQARARAAAQAKARAAAQAKARAAARAAVKRVFPIKMTADNEFTLYVNGQKVGTGNSWTTTYSFNPVVARVDLIAIDAIDRGGPAAIIGTFGNKPSVASQWRCKEYNSGNVPKNWNQVGFNDKSWPIAKSYGRNNQNNIWMQVGRSKRPNIPDNAEWFWTTNYNDHNRVFCRLTLHKPKVVKPKVVKPSIQFNKRSYDKIQLFMKQVRLELDKELKSSKLLTSNEQSKQTQIDRLVKQSEDNMKKTNTQLQNAVRTYNQYKATFSKAHNDNNALIKSLARQREFIKVELDYINRMEQEAAGLKRHTVQYNAIVTEIKQMRTQVHKEIADIERAYARAKSQTSSNVSIKQKKLSSYASTVQRLQNLMKTYKANHENLKLSLQRTQKLKNVSVIGHKTLIALSNGLHDLQSHVNQALTRKIQPNFLAGYQQCTRSKTYVANKYRNMKCAQK